MLHSQYCERKVLVYWVKDLTLIKTIERILGRQSKRKLLIRFAWNMTREWSLTNTLLRFWVGRIDERKIFPFPSSFKCQISPMALVKSIWRDSTFSHLSMKTLRPRWNKSTITPFLFYFILIYFSWNALTQLSWMFTSISIIVNLSKSVLKMLMQLYLTKSRREHDVNQ